MNKRKMTIAQALYIAGIADEYATVDWLCVVYQKSDYFGDEHFWRKTFDPEGVLDSIPFFEPDRAKKDRLEAFNEVYNYIDSTLRYMNIIKIDTNINSPTYGKPSGLSALDEVRAQTKGCRYRFLDSPDHLVIPRRKNIKPTLKESER